MANYLNPNSEITLPQAQSIFGNGPLVGYMAGQNRANQQTQMAANNLMENLNTIKAATGLPGAVEQNKLNQIMTQQKIQQAPLQGQVNQAGLQNQLTQFKTAAAQKGLGFAASVFPQIAQTVQQYGLDSPQTKAAWQAMSGQYQQVTGQPIPPQFSTPNAKGLLALQTAHSYIVNSAQQQQKMAQIGAQGQNQLALRNLANQGELGAAGISAGARRYAADQAAKAQMGKFNFNEEATLGIADQLAKQNPQMFANPDGTPNQAALRQAAAQLMQNYLHPSPITKEGAKAATAGEASKNKIEGVLQGMHAITNPAPQPNIPTSPLPPAQGQAQAGYRVGAIYGGNLQYLGGDPNDESNWKKVQ